MTFWFTKRRYCCFIAYPTRSVFRLTNKSLEIIIPYIMNSSISFVDSYVMLLPCREAPEFVLHMLRVPESRLKFAQTAQSHLGMIFTLA